MPGLDTFTRAHPEVTVLAVNLDDPAAARALFREHHYSMTLVAGDDELSRRYGVATIPHTVVIDAAGRVRKVGHAGEIDLEATIAALAK
jgi:peroxiredoxin